MICPWCNKRMSEESPVFFWCKECGKSAKTNNGGAIIYYDRDGSAIQHPPIENIDKLISSIEDQIAH